MAARAALVTGGSRGIGLGIAKMLGEEGFAVTISGRQEGNLAAAEKELADAGVDVLAVQGNAADEETLKSLVAAHRERFGRLDVLVNSAGVGIGAGIEELSTKALDLQLDVNLRSIVLLYRECTPLLREAAANGGTALVVNLASMAGKSPQPWTSIYSTTKQALIGFNTAMNRELSELGIKSCALCPSFVDTDMTDYMKDQVPAEEMIRVEDVAEVTRTLLRLSKWCLIPEVMFTRPGEVL